MPDLNDKIEMYFPKYDVSNKDTESPEYFSAAVNIALSEYKLPVSDIAREYQVADSTVRRWANGVAVPHPRLRQDILEWIVARI